MSELTVDDILGPRFAGRRFLRPNDLFELGIVDDRATMDYWVEQGVLPPPMRVGKRCLLFPVTEIAALLIARAREREASQPCPSNPLTHSRAPRRVEEALSEL
jgi:hypothetical protein